MDYENNNDIKKFFKSEGLSVLGIDWDTEHIAWYPRFKSIGAAELFIRELNQLFDKKYFKKDTVDKTK